MASIRTPPLPVVLVVEDEPLIRLLAVDLLEEAGFDVIEAGDADRAIELLATRTNIRIVFTDIDMPGTMNGVTLAATIQNRWPPIDIIITSGKSWPASDKLPKRSVFFPKPYNQSSLISVAKSFLS